jgi:hypothetical protein
MCRLKKNNRQAAYKNHKDAIKAAIYASQDFNLLNNLKLSVLTFNSFMN